MIDRLKKWFRIQPESEHKKFDSRLIKLQSQLNFSIPANHLPLFERALRHRSIVDNDKYEAHETYERLEFLGDAVLDLIVTEILFERYPTENEGFLTKMRAKIVRGDTLYELAKNLELNKIVEIGDRAAGQGIELSKSVLADVYEALVAAIYISQGYAAALAFVQKNLSENINFGDIENKIDNYKSLLMEYSQSERLNLPRYSILSEEGPGHDKTFHVAVFIGDKKLGEGKGKSKKKAEQIAAKNALQQISD